MAMTATIALSPSTITSGGPGTVATVTVSNSAALAVNVLGVKPLVYQHSSQQKDESYNAGPVPLPASASSVGAAGSTKFQFPIATGTLRTAGAAGKDSSPATMSLDVTCEVYCQDGTTIIPTVAVLTINPSPHS